MRGPCPGLGAALCAYGIELGTFVAREIAAQVGDNEDPWPLIDQMFQKPQAYLPKILAKEISTLLQKAWQRMPEERKAFLKLLSRFEITPEQAKMLFVQQERKKADIVCSDNEILKNPYLIFEKTINSALPVSVWTVDRGVFLTQRFAIDILYLNHRRSRLELTNDAFGLFVLKSWNRLPTTATLCYLKVRSFFKFANYRSSHLAR
jgi:hypothetical protein